MNIEFTIEVYIFCITKNMNPNYSIIQCFVEKNPNQHFKSMLSPT
jgi:hypothetical protein